jgi:hypothetical protein
MARDSGAHLIFYKILTNFNIKKYEYYEIASTIRGAFD